MVDYEELNRNESKSIVMPVELWNELVKITDDCMSVSEFVRQAIFEKLVKDYPKKKEYYEEIIFT